MPRSIYLPSENETQVTVNINNADIVMDAFDLDEMFEKASAIAKESRQNWKKEFIPLFNTKYGILLTIGQVLFLWNGLQDMLLDLKKKSSPDS
jgi:hypothetical protein